MDKLGYIWQNKGNIVKTVQIRVILTKSQMDHKYAMTEEKTYIFLK